ncbi:MAG: hypothetical protein JWL59_3111 [Chthoniobacteraceae bacterium]|nr:hypothetical protein [Chthoniobacteraceae bacterium]
MNKQDLSTLFVVSLFRIPDYQRGYAWEDKQISDFIEDLDALVEEPTANHYTGTVVTFSPQNGAKKTYGTKQLRVADVVDGQQRLTTVCLYLSTILRALKQVGETAYHRDEEDFLYSGATCKLTPGNDTANLFFDLLKSGHPNTTAGLPHEKRMVHAAMKFQAHLQKQMKIKGSEGTAYLKELHRAITQRLLFTSYTIEEECEIGMTFELMNSRGKDLSVLELLKNYLMHWVSRNEPEPAKREELAALINKSWKDTYKNLGECDGDEDQCLRVAWTLYCSHPPANWGGYDGFKGADFIPLRDFSQATKETAKEFLKSFTEALAEVSRHYRVIINPTATNTQSPEELRWLTKIHNTGNIANFLPLLVAARKRTVAGDIALPEYMNLLKALECFAYRVFLYNGRRSNAGKSNFHRWAWEIRDGSQKIGDVTTWIFELTRYYHPEAEFTDGNAPLGDWYSGRRLLRYTLYELELKLLDDEGKGARPKLAWEDLSDFTIEHILPQNPNDTSNWKKVWTDAERAECLHDIGNLVLTLNNSNYLNFDFDRKKGSPGISPSYCDSPIQQERRISRYTDWTKTKLLERRGELVEWINERWKTEGAATKHIEVNEDENEDGV